MRKTTQSLQKRDSRAPFAAYGHLLTRDEVRARLFRALEANVLGPHNLELRGYYERVVEQLASPFSGAGEDDAISGCSDDDLEQSAVLFCHHDSDGDGLLSRDEFVAVIDMVASQTGQSFTAEHVDHCFQQADVDRSGAIDLNELLLLRARGVVRRR